MPPVHEMSQESIYSTLYATLALTDSIFQIWITLTFAVLIATYVAERRLDPAVSGARSPVFMPSPRGFFSSGLPAQPTRHFTTKTFCACAALNRGPVPILSLSLLESEHSSFSFPAQSAHFGLCVVHGKGETPG